MPKLVTLVCHEGNEVVGITQLDDEHPLLFGENRPDSTIDFDKAEEALKLFKEALK